MKYELQESKETDLHQGEDQYRTILETMEEGYFEVDLKGRYTLVNDAFCKMQGLAREELLGLDYRGYMETETAQRVFELFSGVYETGQPVKIFEWEIKRKNGTRSLHEASVYLIRNSRKEPVGFCGILRDVTERKKVSEVLRQREKESERLAQENAIMAEIGRIIGSTLDVNEVYELFAKEVSKLIPFDRIAINTIDVEKGNTILAYIAGKGVSDRKVGTPYAVAGTAIEEMIRTKSIVHVQTNDLNEVKARFPSLLSTFQAGFRSIVNVPLFAKGQIIGALLLRSLQPDAYRSEDLQIAERVGRQIAGAIANAQLYVEWRRAEEQIRESEERFRSIFDTSVHGIFRTTPGGRFIALNPAMAGIHGYGSPEEMIAEVTDIGSQLYVHKEDYERYCDLLRRQGLAKDFEFESLRKDGSKIWISLSTRAIRDTSGNLLYQQGNAVDITERRRAAEALRESEERFRLIYNNSADGILLATPDGSILAANPAVCRMFGRTEEDLRRIGRAGIVDASDPRVAARFQEREYTGILRSELFHIREDGTRFLCEVSSNVFKDKDGQPRTSTILRDITERKRADKTGVECQTHLADDQSRVNHLIIVLLYDDRCDLCGIWIPTPASRPKKRCPSACATGEAYRSCLHSFA